MTTMTSSDPFGDAIARIETRLALTESHESPPKTAVGQGPLTVEELSQLSLLCTWQAESEPEGFSSVDPSQLTHMVEMLEEHVSLAVGIKLIGEAAKILRQHDAPTRAAAALDQWIRPGRAGNTALVNLRMGLEAASVIFFLAALPDLDKRIVNEDALETSITLFRTHLRDNLIPSLNQTGHVQLLPLDDTHAVENESPSKKRRRSTHDTMDSIAKELKRIYTHINATVNLQLVLMNRLQQLVVHCPLDDQQILMLSNGAMTALEIDCCATANTASDIPNSQQLQHVSIAIVAAAFAKYPSHRETILEDIFPLMLRLPSGKKSLRAFPLRYASATSPSSLQSLVTSLFSDILPNGTEPHYLQMVTAMILAMVQACVQRPVYHHNVLISGLRGCQSIADLIVSQLLERCARQRSSQFRPIFVHIVEDLVLACLVPEYPAAAMLLVSITRHLIHDLANAVKNKTMELTYLNTAFDVLGKIGAAEARILKVHREKPIVAKVTPDSRHSDDDYVVGCHCGNSTREKLLIECDGCRTCYHGDCVGIYRDNIPEQWVCDGCCLGNIILRERRKYKLKGDESFIDGVYAMRHCLLSHLAHRLGVSDMNDATSYNFAQWVDLLAAVSDESARKVITDIINEWGGISPSPTGEALSEEGSTQMMLALFVHNAPPLSESSQQNTSLPLLDSFRKQIAFILGLMDDSPNHIRKLSVKTIEKIVEGDPSLMLLPIITKAVSSRLSDSTISVREATVSLVGKYVEKYPSVASNYHAALVSCLHDEGLSVRKRAVKIFQSILFSNPGYKGRAAICDSLLLRANDPKEEDAVRDLIYELFSNLWLRNGETSVPDFQSPSTQHRNILQTSPPGALDHVIVARSVPGVVTPTPPAAKPPTYRKKKRVDVTAEQMMEVVRKGGNSENLERVLKILLGETSDADKDQKHQDRKKRVDATHMQCDKIVHALFEVLVSIEVRRSSRGTRVGKDLAATLQTICVFAEVVPMSVFRHLDTILPYLKADNGVSIDEETSIVGATCDIIHRVCPAIDSHHVERLSGGSMPQDLVQIVYKFGTTALASAISLLSELASLHAQCQGTAFRKKLFELIRTFYSYLCKKEGHDDFSNVEEKVRSNVHRSLTVLGLVCQCHKSNPIPDENDIDAYDQNFFDVDNVDDSNLLLACYTLFTKFLDKKDASTKCVALRALGGIFASQPRLMLQLEQLGLIGKVISDGQPISLQLEALQVWRTILVIEEKRIDGGQAHAKMERDSSVTLSKQIAGDQDGDATLFGGVLTNHTDRLFEMTHSKDRLLRFAALDLLGVLLRQGLVNPNEAVPHLYALQGDVNNEAIRTLALKLLITEGEKHPDSLRQRACAGVKQAYKFQKAIYPEKREVSALLVSDKEVECILALVYRQCITKNRRQRTGLFKNLLTLFEVQEGASLTRKSMCGNTKKNQSKSKDLGLLSFASQILAHLPYNNAGDPLFIIYHITSIVNLYGTQIVDRFAEVLRVVGLASSDADDEANVEEDNLEKAARSKFPSRTQEARPLNSDKFDTDSFVNLCREAAGLNLLLRLKAFLRNIYNLSEMRCLEYDPSTKENLSDKGISKTDVTKKFDATVPAFLLDSNKNVDKDALIRQYAEFRRLMRDDGNAEAGANACFEGDKKEDVPTTPP